jgi:hypothetical protein
MKKKMKINIIFVFSLVLILILFNTCKRATPDQRSPAININTPFSPSGFATTLKLSASPNVISAGTTPEVSAVTVTLTKTGTALSGKTIIFAIYDELGNKIDLGYFEGSISVASKTTDSNGMATVNYYGPLASELAENTVVNIGAAVSGIGNESISGNAPIYIIADMTEIRLNIYTTPTVLNAGVAPRETSTITATLMTAVGGIPLANWNIRFEITDADGSRIYVGYFDSNEQVVTKVTDATGTATTIYSGPLALELPDLVVGDDTVVYIRVTAWLGEVSVSETAPIIIYII